MSISVLILFVILALCLKSKDLALMFSAIMMPMLGTFGMTSMFGLLFVVSLIFVFLYIREIKTYFKKREIYWASFLAYILLTIVSAVVAQDKHYFMALQSIFAFTTIPLCLCRCLKTKKNVLLFPKVAFVCCCFCIAYSIYELLTFSNPIVELALAQNVFTGELMTGVRFGFKQIQCVFSYHETAGCFFWMMAVFFMWLMLTENATISKKKLIIIIALASICCFLTGSRSSIISLCIGLAPLAIANKKYIFLVPIIFCICAYCMPDYFSTIFSSIVDSDNSNVGGSNADLRERQLDASLYYMYSSPKGAFWGHGLGYTNDYLIGNVSDLAGAESLWFRLMIDQGILGILVMVYFFVYSIFILFKVNKFMPFMVLAFLCAKTIAVVPCVEVSWLFVFVIYFYSQRNFEYDKNR